MKMFLGATIEAEDCWDPGCRFSAPVPMNLSRARAHVYTHAPPFPPYIVEPTYSFCLVKPNLLINIICGLTSFCWSPSLHSQQSLCMWVPGNVSCCLCQPHTPLPTEAFSEVIIECSNATFYLLSLEYSASYTLHICWLSFHCTIAPLYFS